MRAPEGRVQDVCLPRLLGVRAAARYLGLSGWQVRNLIHRGVLQVVRVPLERKLLLDRDDLNVLIKRWKQ
jgi:excisionase family DNA binding protein